MKGLLETLFTHSSHYIQWAEGSGCQSEQHRLVSGAKLQFTLLSAPSDLKLIEKDSVLVLQRNLPGITQAVISSTHLTAQERDNIAAMDRSTQISAAKAPYSITLSVSDLKGIYNPQRLALTTIAEQSKYTVKLFRSPMGNVFNSAGGVFGHVIYEDDTPASWAVINVEINLGNEEPLLTFKGQCDARGEFSLAMNRLPAPDKNSINTQYEAQLTVIANLDQSADIADINQLTAFNILEDAALDSSEIAHLAFKFSVAQVQRLRSENHLSIVLKTPT
ncbi:MAG: hypothetical protein V7784_07780 [Oceanospirillaceae bacterium]